MLRSAYFISIILFILSCKTVEEPTTLNIATSANMQFAIKPLVDSFTRQTGIACNIIIGSSGKLTAQIKEGAPFDLFISADMKYPESLFEAGLSDKPPKVYASGLLVLWSFNTPIDRGLDILLEDQVQHIAVPNPEIAPYGIAAFEVLEHQQLKDQLSEKLIFGESIAQTNQFVATKAADIGFTAKAVVLSPDLKDKGYWHQVDTSFYHPIHQGAILIKQKDGPKTEARAFYQFLFSPQAKEILKNFGYLVE